MNDQATRSILTGSPLPRAFVDAVTDGETQRAALDESSTKLGRDLNVAIEAAARRRNVPVTEVYDEVGQVLDGDVLQLSVLRRVDPALAARAEAARNHLDNLSTAIAGVLPQGRRQRAVFDNLGSWMRRSYSAFDKNSGWNFDNLQTAADNGAQINGVDAREIFENGRQYLREQHPEVNDAELESIMRDIMDRDTFQTFAGGGAVRMEVSSLIMRQDIPAPIRALMGEETNPVHRFSQSTSFQSNFLHRHQEQIAMRGIGLQGGLFAEERGGTNTHQIGGGELGLAWAGLQGLWTTPQLWRALQNTRGAVEGDDIGSWMWEALRWTSNEAKLNRVALNPDSWMVNILGNVTALAQTGDVFYRSFFGRVHEAAKLRASGRAKDGDVYDAAVEGVIDSQRALMARLNAAGVTSRTLRQQDLTQQIPRHLLQWLENDSRRDRLAGAGKGAIAGRAIGKGFGPSAEIAGAAVGALAGGAAGYNTINAINQRIAGLVMTAPDQMARVIGYLGNYETALAAGFEGDAAFEWAVERTRNTFPDYDKIPAVVRTLSKLGVVGSFISFQWEVYRNTFHNVRYGVQELRSGNPALAGRGIRRLVGTASLGTLASGGLAGLLGAAGADDEKNRRWRKWFGAPWERHAIMAFTRFNEEGVSYFNTSYLLPTATILELGRAALDAEKPADTVGNVLTQAWQQFLGSSVHLDPILQAYVGTDGRGRAISSRKGLGNAIDRIEHVSRTVLEPGWTNKLERLGFALRGAKRKGREFSIEEETKRLMGIRQFSRDWPA
ncbi:hypothetical protein OAF27_03530, partial [Verrucomicrobiales bacterium]|nr:hypothetical protein [Verrucomicrobiales bacterium]